MKYSPVAIPTLCRYEHLIKCIESLSKCTGADQTDVFVALDYPAIEAHWEGYNKINAYLKNCGNLGFKKLHIIKRKTNIGIGKGKISNLKLLVDDIFKTSDRVIISEDDNVFSPNFLEYVDKGLDLFENDKTVLSINGYSHSYPFKFNGNNHFRHNTDFSAWGYGIWKDRYETYIDDIVQNQ